MTRKPTNEELEQRVKELEHEAAKRKQVEKALQESEENFRSLSESSTDYIMRYDRECRHTYVNAACAAVAGISVDKFIGKTHREMGFDKEQYEVWEEKIQQVFETGEPQQWVFEFEGSQGPMYLDWRIVPEFSANREVMTVLGVSRDITALKQAEETLRQSEERYAKAEEIGNSGHWDRNFVEEKATWSRQAYRIFGLDPDQFQPSYDAFLDRLHPSDREFVKRKVEQALSRVEPFDTEYRIVRPDGTERVIHSVAEVRFDKDGQPVRLVGTVHDITERKKAEEQLNKLVRIIEETGDCIAIGTPDGQIHYMNKAGMKMLGWGKDILNYKIADAHPKWAADLIMREAVPTCIEKGIWRGETALLSPDGSEIPTSQAVIPHLAEDGKVEFMSTIVRDITERKRAEEALRKAHDQLELRVEERTAELAKANEDLKQEMEERKLAQEALLKREKELETKSANLEEANTALKVLLTRRDEDRVQLEEKVLSNVNQLITPYIEKLKKGHLESRQEAYVNVLESNLQEVISPFSRSLSRSFLNFTPTEIQVSNLIKHGKSTKAIAQLLDVSDRTIDSHRESIRKKLGIKRKKTNLRAYLLSIQ